MRAISPVFHPSRVIRESHRKPTSNPFGARQFLHVVVDFSVVSHYVREMNALDDAPRWYNALTHNCTTTIWHHAKAVGSDFPLDWRLLANGYLVDLSYELGTVNTCIGLDEPKRRSDITTRAREAGTGEGFSLSIRDGLPSRPSTVVNRP
jgi:hypothetical protein